MKPKHLEEKVEVGSQSSSCMERYFCFCVIAGATILALIAIQPLFTPGYLMNFDHPLRQGLLECYLDGPMWSLPATWCSFLQAGVAPFQSYLIMFNWVVLAFHLVFSLELAYKLGLMVVWFLLPTAIAVILWRRGHPLMAAFAFTLLLLDHGAQDATGLEFFLIVNTGMGQVLGYGMLAITLAIAVEVYSRPTWRGVGGLSLSTAIYFLSHPTTFQLFIPILVIVSLIHWREILRHQTMFLLYPILVFLLASHFLFPVLANLQSVEPGGIVSQIPSFWPLVQEKIGDNMNPILIVFGIIGLSLLAWKGRESIWAIPALAGAILISWVLYPFISWTHIFDFAQLGRTIGIMYNLLLIGSAAFIEFLVKCGSGLESRKKVGAFMVVILVFGFLSTDLFFITLGRSQDIKTLSHPAFSKEVQFLKSVRASPGRILVEETYGQTDYPLNISSVWGIAPVFSGVDLVNPSIRFFKYPYAGSQGGNIQGMQLAKMSRGELTGILEDWNIAAVVAGSPQYRDSFSFLAIEKTMGTMIVYRNNATPVDYFYIADGIIEHSGYIGTYGAANVTANKDQGVLFKVRYWNNWRAYVDREPGLMVRNDQDFMAVYIPRGNHVIEFKYAMRWWDYIGWLMTFIGLLVCAGIIIPVKKWWSRFFNSSFFVFV